jgi:uncharacterized protein (DUF58 family)
MKVSEGFNRELTERLDRLRLRFTKQVGGVSGGIRRSSEKGTSNEFSDFRSYTDGDSLRYVDWNSYARLDKLFVKLYMEEKQTEVSIVTDCSASMDFGNKAYTSGLLSAALCYAIAGGGDKAELFMGENGFAFRSKSELSPLLKFIDESKYGGVFDAEQTVKKLPLNGRGRTILISDFLYPCEELERAVKYLAYKKRELWLIMVTCKEEELPTLSGELTLNDAETEDKINLEIDDEVIEDYRNAVRTHRSSISALCRRYGAELTQVSADEAFTAVISRLLS